MAMELLTTELLTNAALVLLAASAIVIIASLAVLSLKSREESEAKRILRQLEKMKKGKKPAKEKKMLKIKPGETSLKDMLTQKFMPRIEAQLKTKVKVLDFNAKEDNFLALIDISGVKLLLTLDQAGKIIDYKKVKKKKQ